MIKLMFHKIVPFLQRVNQHEDIFNYKDKQQFGNLAVMRKKYIALNINTYNAY